LELFTSACVESQMKGFNELDLSNVIHGEEYDACVPVTMPMV
jgi:hypothetical protein